AGVELLGQGEDVPVAEAGGGAVGDAVRLEAGRDLQGVDGGLAQLAVAVQQGLHRVGAPAGGGSARLTGRRADVGHRAASVTGTCSGAAQRGTGRGAGSVQWPGTWASAGLAKGRGTPVRSSGRRRTGVRATASR